MLLIKQMNCTLNERERKRKMKIIGLVGFIGSGKGTAGDYFVDNGYVQDSFAASLKDAVAAMFGWDRTLLEGITDESRIWRDEVDQWWAYELGIPEFTPRYALQYYGTNVFRKYIHSDLWLKTMQLRLETTTADKVVITDVRFKNEIRLIAAMGGEILWVQRNGLPDWYNTALDFNTSDEDTLPECSPLNNIHQSEWDWIGRHNYKIIDNDKDISHLHQQLNSI